MYGYSVQGYDPFVLISFESFQFCKNNILANLDRVRFALKIQICIAISYNTFFERVKTHFKIISKNTGKVYNLYLQQVYFIEFPPPDFENLSKIWKGS